MESLAFMYGGAIKSTETENVEIKIRRSAEGVVTGSGDTLSIVLHDGATQKDYSGSASLGAVVSGAALNFINFTTGKRVNLTTPDAELSVADVVAQMKSANTSTAGTFNTNDRVRVFWEEIRNNTTDTAGVGAVKVEISADTFPGTWKFSTTEYGLH